MADCEKYQELISLYVDRGISDEEKAELLKHMEHCDDCAELLSIYSQVSRLMADDTEPPEELLSGVMSGVQEINAGRKKAGGRSAKTALKWLAIAACAVIILIPGIRLLSTGFGATSADSSANESAGSTREYSAADDSFDSSSADAADYDSAEAEDIQEPSGDNEISLTDGAPGAEGSSGADDGSFTAADISEGYYAVVYADSFPDELEELSQRTLFTFSDGTCGAQITMDEFKLLESTGNYSITLKNDQSEIALLVYTP